MCLGEEAWERGQGVEGGEAWVIVDAHTAARSRTPKAAWRPGSGRGGPAREWPVLRTQERAPEGCSIPLTDLLDFQWWPAQRPWAPVTSGDLARPFTRAEGVAAVGAGLGDAAQDGGESQHSPPRAWSALCIACSRGGR